RQRDARAITLAGSNSDVWAWTRNVHGQIADLDCKAIMVNSNQEQVQAQVKGTKFSATVPIAEGENHIGATCDQADGTEISSKPVLYIGLLRRVPLSVVTIAINGNQIVLDGNDSQP